MIRNYLILLIFVLGWNSLPAQSASLSMVADSMPTLQKHYLYPSIIRALGSVSEDNSMNELIEGLYYVLILRVDSALLAKKGENFKDVPQKLEAEGYENFASYTQKGSEFMVFALEESDGLADFILVQREKHSQLYIEFVGQLKMTSIQKIMAMDLDMFKMFIE